MNLARYTLVRGEAPPPADEAQQLLDDAEGLQRPSTGRRFVKGASIAGAIVMATAAVVLVVVMGRGGGSPWTFRPEALGACKLTRERMEGPFYLTENLFRPEIRENEPGIPLRLRINVTDPDCNPLPNTFVDIWQCNTTGVYSGYTEDGGFPGKHGHGKHGHGKHGDHGHGQEDEHPHDRRRLAEEPIDTEGAQPEAEAAHAQGPSSQHSHGGDKHGHEEHEHAHGPSSQHSHDGDKHSHDGDKHSHDEHEHDGGKHDGNKHGHDEHEHGHKDDEHSHGGDRHGHDEHEHGPKGDKHGHDKHGHDGDKHGDDKHGHKGDKHGDDKHSHEGDRHGHDEHEHDHKGDKHGDDKHGHKGDKKHGGKKHGPGHGKGPGRHGPPHAKQTDNTTFLRGTLLTDADGIVEFTTIVPGWYPGRAPHIHMKVHIPDEVSGNMTEADEYADSHVSHTGQVFFSEDFYRQIEGLEPYTADKHHRTLLPEDSDYHNDPTAVLDLIPEDPEELGKGVSATVTIIVDPEAEPPVIGAERPWWSFAVALPSWLLPADS